MSKALTTEAIAALRAQSRGALLQPGEEGYEKPVGCGTARLTAAPA